MRQKGVIVSTALTTTVAVSAERHREVLGIGASEAEIFWLEFLRKLKHPDLAGLKLDW